MNPDILRAKLIAAMDAVLSEHLGPSAPSIAGTPKADVDFLDPADFAERINVSRRTVLRWIRLGLPHGRVGNTIRVKVREAEKWMADGGAIAAARQHASRSARKGQAA